jgi:hypothetical protein
MNQAVEMVSNELNISIPEYTVAGVPHGNLFAHQWYIATDDKVGEDSLRSRIDEKLKELNDDYAVERKHALKDVYVKVLPEQVFMDFMRSKGKIGGQHKFPRVLKGQIFDDWQAFLKSRNLL